MKDVRFKLADRYHAALSIIVKHEGTTIEAWASSVIRAELAQRIALSHKLAAACPLLEEAENESPPTRWLYFIRRGEDGAIKIGVTRDIGSRLAALQTAHDEGLTTLYRIEESKTEGERRIHRRFARHRKQGEWFHPVPEILEFIDELSTRNAHPESGRPGSL